jgi:hypothetical protein
MTYKLIVHTSTAPNPSCIKRDDGVLIPFDPANTDYQEYLAWLDEGNEPLPADELTSEV